MYVMKRGSVLVVKVKGRNVCSNTGHSGEDERSNRV
jgi:hypothetical protein